MLIVLIHNNEINRLSYIREKISRLIEEFPKTQIEYIEIFERSEVKLSKLQFFLRNFHLKLIQVKWLLMTNRVSSKNTSQIFLKIIKIARNRSRSSKNIISEIDLTFKHLAAWNYFDQNTFQELFVFESDAIIDFLDCLVNYINIFVNNMNMQLLMGGLGYEIEELGVDAVSHAFGDCIFHTSKQLTTNTTVFYGVKKDLVKAMLSNSSRRMRLLPIDWMMNSLFLKLNGNIYRGTMLAMKKSVLNGSQFGYYESSIQF